ncbi:MAG: D-alanine--D-alanine ligase [Candidatus Taylorbacteria bacterium]
MKKKIKVGILFGGKSAEHEVSVRSARNVLEAMDKSKYEPVLIGIDKKGRWHMSADSKALLHRKSLESGEVSNSDSVALVNEGSGKLTGYTNLQNEISVDVVFPILHGPFGEDGTVQGLLKLANVPFVGAGVLGSAVGMDKDVMKRLLRDAGIPIGKFLTFKTGDKIDFKKVKYELGLPMFVKPANMGSSVGVSKVRNENEFKKAIKTAFDFDLKILIEQNIEGREIECAVLGNEKPIASVPGEVVLTDDFYSYEAKYIDENGAVIEIPAKLDKVTAKRIQTIAIKTFKALSCEGLGRVDCFIKNGDILVNEINTIPGFTSISMYPKLFEVSGISYSNLIDRLITLAIERFKKEQKLKTSY